MGLNESMTGYKKLDNKRDYTTADLLAVMKGVSYSFGEPKLGKIAKKESIVFDNLGRFTVYVKVSEKSIEIGRVITQSTGMAFLMELGAALLTDAKAKDTAVADRAVEELYDVLNELLKSGKVENKSSKNDGIKLYMLQKVLSINDKFDICDMDQNPIYKVEGNLLSHGYKIEDESGSLLVEIKKKMIAVMPEYTFLQDGNTIGHLKKKVRLTRPEITGEINGKEIEIKGDLSGYHFAIKLDEAVIGDVDTERLTWGNVYSIDVRDESMQDIVVSIAIVVDNMLKNVD